MKRRGFLGGALATALSGAFVVRNPTILENGLVVPETAHAILPVEIGKPIAIQTSSLIPRATASAYVYEYSMHASRDPVLRDLGISSPVEIELTLRMSGDAATHDALRQLFENCRPDRSVQVHFTSVQPDKRTGV